MQKIISAPHKFAITSLENSENLVKTLLFFLESKGYNEEIIQILIAFKELENAILALCKHLKSSGTPFYKADPVKMEESLNRREKTIQFLVLGLQGLRKPNQPYDPAYQQIFQHHLEKIGSGIGFQVHRLLNKAVNVYQENLDWAQGWKTNGLWDYCNKMIQIFNHFQWKDPETTQALTYILSKWYEPTWLTYLETITKDSIEGQIHLINTLVRYLDPTQKESSFFYQMKDKTYKQRLTVINTLFNKIIYFQRKNSLFNRKKIVEIIQYYMPKFFSNEAAQYLCDAEEFDILFNGLSKNIINNLVFLNQVLNEAKNNHILALPLLDSINHSLQTTVEILNWIIKIKGHIPLEKLFSFKEAYEKEVQQIYTLHGHLLYKAHKTNFLLITQAIKWDDLLKTLALKESILTSSHAIQKKFIAIPQPPILIPFFPKNALSEIQDPKFNPAAFQQIQKDFETWCTENLNASPQKKLKIFSQLLVQHLNVEVMAYKLIKNGSYKAQNWFNPLFPQTKETLERIQEIEKNIYFYKSLFKKDDFYSIDYMTFLKDPYINPKPVDSILKMAIDKFAEKKKSFFFQYSAQEYSLDLEQNKKNSIIFGKENMDNIRYFPIYNKGELHGIIEIKQWLKSDNKMDTALDIRQFEALFETLNQSLSQGHFFDAEHCLDPNTANVRNYPYPWDKSLQIEEISNPANRCPELKSLIIGLIDRIIKKSYGNIPIHLLEAYFNASKLIFIRKKGNPNPLGFIAVDHLNSHKSKPLYISAIMLCQEIQKKRISQFFTWKELLAEMYRRYSKFRIFLLPWSIRIPYLFRSNSPTAAAASIRANTTYPNIQFFKSFSGIIRAEIKKAASIVLEDGYEESYAQFLKILIEDEFVLFKDTPLKQDWASNTQFAQFLLTHLKDLSFNLYKIRHFENPEYQVGRLKYNANLSKLYQDLHQYIQQKTPSLYKEIAKEKARLILGENVDNLDYFDPVFFILKRADPGMDMRLKEYSSMNLHRVKDNKLSKITQFVHGLVNYQKNQEKLDLVTWIGEFTPFAQLKFLLALKSRSNKR